MKADKSKSRARTRSAISVTPCACPLPRNISTSPSISRVDISSFNTASRWIRSSSVHPASAASLSGTLSSKWKWFPIKHHASARSPLNLSCLKRILRNTSLSTSPNKISCPAVRDTTCTHRLRPSASPRINCRCFLMGIKPSRFDAHCQAKCQTPIFSLAIRLRASIRA